MPFKYRDRRNKYFKEYMRKWRAEKRQSQSSDTDLECDAKSNNTNSYTSEHPKLYEVLAA